MIQNLRKKSILLALVMVLAVFSGIVNIAKGNQVSEWSSYSDDYFSISYPANWMVIENKAQDVPTINEIIIFSEASGNIAFNVVIENLSGYNLTLEKYMELGEMQLELAADAITPINTYTNGNAIKVNIDGADAYKIIYILNLGNVEGVEIKAKNMQVMTLKGEKAYILTYQVLNNEFDNYVDIVDKMIETFKFID